MSSLTPISGIIVRCDPTTKLYLEKKDSENIGSQRFIKCSLGDDCIFIEESKENYVQGLAVELYMANLLYLCSVIFAKCS